MIITRAPFRIPLGGGGTDLPSYYSRYGGFVVSASIDKYVFTHLNPLKVEKCIRIKHARTEEVYSLSGIQHPLLREALQFAAIYHGIEIALLADVPAGSGLGSSGAFLVSLLAALNVHKGKHINPLHLAEDACHIEIDLAAQPVGKQDQYMAAFGGLTCLDIDLGGRVTVTPLHISPHDLYTLQHRMVLFYTGILRKSFDILSDQKDDTQQGKKDVVESLHATKQLGLEIKHALETGTLDCFGQLLDVHWENKKKRSGKITNQTIDAWYRLAKKNGALGGKLMGAGGGGFLIFYCPEDARARVCQALREVGLREMAYSFDFEGARLMTQF